MYTVYIRVSSIFSLSLTRGSVSAAEPPICSSPSLSLFDAATATAALLLVPERLRFGTRPDELAPPARARFFFCWFFFLGGLWEGLGPSCWFSRPRPGSPRARLLQVSAQHADAVVVHVRHQHAPVGQKREPGRVIELRLRRSAVMVPPLLAVARHRAPAGGPGTAVRVTLRP